MGSKSGPKKGQPSPIELKEAKTIYRRFSKMSNLDEIPFTC